MAADKKLLASLLSKPAPAAEDSEAMEAEAPAGEGAPSDKAVAAQDVMDALKAGDAAGFASALEAFVGLVGA